MKPERYMNERQFRKNVELRTSLAGGKVPEGMDWRRITLETLLKNRITLPKVSILEKSK